MQMVLQVPTDSMTLLGWLVEKGEAAVAPVSGVLRKPPTLSPALSRSLLLAGFLMCLAAGRCALGQWVVNWFSVLKSSSGWSWKVGL